MSSSFLEFLGLVLVFIGVVGNVLIFAVVTADWHYWSGCFKEYMRRMRLRQKIAELPLEDLEEIDKVRGGK